MIDLKNLRFKTTGIRLVEFQEKQFSQGLKMNLARLFGITADIKIKDDIED